MRRVYAQGKQVALKAWTVHWRRRVTLARASMCEHSAEPLTFSRDDIVCIIKPATPASAAQGGGGGGGGGSGGGGGVDEEEAAEEERRAREAGRRELRDFVRKKQAARGATEAFVSLYAQGRRELRLQMRGVHAAAVAAVQVEE